MKKDKMILRGEVITYSLYGSAGSFTGALLTKVNIAEVLKGHLLNCAN